MKRGNKEYIKLTFLTAQTPSSNWRCFRATSKNSSKLKGIMKNNKGKKIKEKQKKQKNKTKNKKSKNKKAKIKIVIKNRIT